MLMPTRWLAAILFVGGAFSSVRGQCSPPKLDPYDLRTARSRSAVRRPSLEQLQALARQYYPGLARTDAPARVTIGFVLDTACNVLRHSAAFAPDTVTPDSLLRVMFPDRRSSPVSSGVADNISGAYGRDVHHVVAVWEIVR